MNAKQAPEAPAHAGVIDPGQKPYSSYCNTSHYQSTIGSGNSCGYCRLPAVTRFFLMRTALIGAA